MNHLYSWTAPHGRAQYPASRALIAVLGMGCGGGGGVAEDAASQTGWWCVGSPSLWSSGRLSKEPPTDMCNQPHVSLALSLPLWLMSPPDSIEAIKAVIYRAGE